MACAINNKIKVYNKTFSDVINKERINAKLEKINITLQVRVSKVNILIKLLEL